MSDIAITIENLGKEYRIGAAQERYGSLRDTLTEAFMGPVRRARSLLRGESYGAAELNQTIWALKDISFEVKHGEVVGIIGRNGAGKSTLLKILSRITEPTEGRVVLNGRVGALLEVGTGFHPELTGRENVYLNGAILGMTREEINKRFDEIIDFSGVERFIDTPMKHFSSGMILRLGFAVASHLEPEILVVDEVLAVGDAEFQKKCLGKMNDVANEGRTVLFVSHNLGAVESLCERGVILQQGELIKDDDVTTVVQHYVHNLSLNSAHSTVLEERTDRRGSGEARFTSVQIKSGDNGEEIPTSVVRMGGKLTIEATYCATEEVIGPVFGFLIADNKSNIVIRSYSQESHPDVPPPIQPGTNAIVRCTFPHLPLMYGIYYVHLWVSRHSSAIDYIEYATSFEIQRYDVYQTGRVPNAFNGGVCFAPHHWEFKA